MRFWNSFYLARQTSAPAPGAYQAVGAEGGDEHAVALAQAGPVLLRPKLTLVLLEAVDKILPAVTGRCQPSRP